DTATAEYQSDYQGTTYYFCGAGCKRAFDKNPDEFIGHKASNTEQTTQE
ncbi:MAG: YHS domain-containing protein, partial [Chloroflexota bacterium]